jgi:hypothetical protein
LECRPVAKQLQLSKQQCKNRLEVILKQTTVVPRQRLSGNKDGIATDANELIAQKLWKGTFCAVHAEMS